MAIYTQYGRYLKAKEFKDSIENNSDGIYMLLGLGNPRWRVGVDSGAAMQLPIAPYNSSIIRDGTKESNQFYDDQVFQYLETDGNATLLQGIPANDVFINKVEDILPPFPCIWKNRTDVLTDEDYILENDSVSLEEYEKYYITKDNGTYYLYRIDGQLTEYDEVSFPTSDIEKQYFAELYLRGLCSTDSNIKAPVGLLGAVRCDISFVRDIGDETDYTGDINQFFYGDRYWEIVRPDDNILNKVGNNVEYPHHLLVTAIINPRQLCDSDLDVDQCIVPTQIALYVKEKETGVTAPTTYTVGNNIFNFGQYTKGDLSSLEGSNTKPVLNFTMSCTDGGASDYPNGQFKFLLSDYIKGNTRDSHTADRIGYIIGF